MATHEAVGDYRPTDQGVAYKNEVTAQIDTELENMAAYLGQKIPELNALISESDVQFINLETPRKEIKP